MTQTSERPGAADSGPIRSQSLAGSGHSAHHSLPGGTVTAYDRVLNHLRDNGKKVRETSPGKARALCPAHDGTNPTALAITRIQGSVLLYCHVGCHIESVLASLEMTKADLYDDRRGATYSYDDGRQAHRTSDKRFWQSGNTNSTPTLYRLSRVQAAVLAGHTVYLVEGEKDVHALESIGLTATTAPMGADNFRKVDVTPLAGAKVVAIVDKDEAGRKWAQQVRKALKPIAKSLEFRQAKVGKDASDHIAADFGIDDLEAVEVEDSPPKAALAALITDLRGWQDLPDPGHIVNALAVAATRKAEGEACWLLLVAPPSSGKTEGVRLLDDIADARLDEVTAAGLLSWTKGKNPRPTGVLTRIPTEALVTFGDLSSLLATSDRGGRDQVFALLRRAYDGHTYRDVASPNGDRLEWSGRLTVVACVTGIIDRYAAHADQLGPRWLYDRIPERSIETKQDAAKRSRRKGLDEHRKRARESVAALLASLPAELPDLPDAVWDAIDDAALVTAWGRGAVPRNGYGRREIEGIPVVEEPMRLVQQLGALARGILALGLSDESAAALARRVALNSMPEARRAVLQVLTTGEVVNTSGCARRAGIDRKVARMTLEDLAAIGVVENDRPDTDDDEYDGAVSWRLSGEAGEIISRVFEAFHQSGGGWDEMWVYTSLSPPIREEEEAEEGDSSESEPTFRPTPDDPSDQWDFMAALGTDDTPTCFQCGKELVWTDEQRSGVCSRCDPEANLFGQEEQPA